MNSTGRLVVVSNRVPSPLEPPTQEQQRTQSVSGVVSAIWPALEERGGLWFGWSGKSVEGRASTIPTVSDIGSVRLATIDLSQNEMRLFYTEFANQNLWPLLHGFPARMVIWENTYQAYRRLNRRFAEALHPLLQSDDLVWVHDYHFLLLGSELRRLGWSGKVGFLLHVPFPSADTFAILPWARHLLQGLFTYDLVGVQTSRDAHNLLESIKAELGGITVDRVVSRGERSLQVGVYPDGIDAAAFGGWASQAGHGQPSQLLRRFSGRQRMILGVDRLDYTKGIPGRLLAFEHLLEHYPSRRGQVSLIQISVPSRSHIPEYIQEKEQVDRLVGRINGHFSEADWVPVHYLYRSYTQQDLAGFYRTADVCLVTPLRDGMNLIAKEFVASQGDDPGVLVLSRFCGAAETMQEALIVNPYDIGATAAAINRALNMSRAERHRRREALSQVVRTQTAQAWCDAFLADLVGPEELTVRARGAHRPLRDQALSNATTSRPASQLAPRGIAPGNS